LICQPVGHEYVNSHRALRHLAARLAEAGFPVLRFDYYGCGDSSGNSEDASVAQWLKDISAAVVRIETSLRSFPHLYVGLRFGCDAGSSGRLLNKATLKAWSFGDPVMEGEKYFDELLLLERKCCVFVRSDHAIRSVTPALKSWDSLGPMVSSQRSRTSILE